MCCADYLVYVVESIAVWLVVLKEWSSNETPEPMSSPPSAHSPRKLSFAALRGIREIPYPDFTIPSDYDAIEPDEKKLPDEKKAEDVVAKIVDEMWKWKNQGDEVLNFRQKKQRSDENKDCRRRCLRECGSNAGVPNEISGRMALRSMDQ